MLESWIVKKGYTARYEYITLLFIKLAIIGVFLPAKLSNIAMFLLASVALLTGNYRAAVSKLAAGFLLFFLVFFFAHVAGLIHTEHLSIAIKELDKKIPFLVVPVTLSLLPAQLLYRNRNELLIFFFKTALVVSVLFLAIASYKFLQSGNASMFFYLDFTAPLGLHPIYYAIFLLFGLCSFLLISHDTKPKAWIYVSVIIYCLVILVLVSSKTALLVFVVIILTTVFVRLRHISIWNRILASVILAVTVLSFVWSFPVTRERIQDALGSNWDGILSKDYTYTSSTYTGVTLRISFWKVTLIEMYEKNVLLFGVGTGDQTSFLNEAYKNYGLLESGYANFNLHNTFMEMLLEFGLAGLLLLLSALCFLFVRACLSSDYLTVALMMLFFIFSLTESLWNVNKGIFFFTFFFCLISVSNVPKLNGPSLH